MHPLLEYFKGPELVVKVQEYFGIVYERNAKKESPSVANGSFHQNETGHGEGLSNETAVNFATNKKIDDDDNAYRVTNYFWYVLFIIGTELGDELFYATFIPFWFWNIDSAVGRRVVLLWSAIMYVGQSLKDVIRWPRPSYPAARLQKKWGMEYGMPSTHAMVSVAIPFSVLIYTYDRYIYFLPVGLVIAFVWCAVICVSRVYLGMHSVLDILAGLLLVVLLMIPLIPIVDRLDTIIVTARWSPLYVLVTSLLLIILYLRASKWTPISGDVLLAVVSACAGVEIGAWLHYQSGELQPPTQLPPYEISWPTYSMLKLQLLRTVLGLCWIATSRVFVKSSASAFLCVLLRQQKNELGRSEDTLENKNKLIVEMLSKLFTFGMIGFDTQYLLPKVFKLLNIGRPDF